MKAAIFVLEKRLRKVSNRLKRKQALIQSLGFQHKNMGEASQTREYIERCKQEVEDLKKAIFFLNRTEQNLINSQVNEIRESNS